MWRYGPSVQAEVTRYVLERHAGYASALDMGCNEGFMLARLQVRPALFNIPRGVRRAEPA